VFIAEHTSKKNAVIAVITRSAVSQV